MDLFQNLLNAFGAKVDSKLNRLDEKLSHLSTSSRGDSGDAVRLRVFANSDSALMVWKISQRIKNLRGFAIETKLNGAQSFLESHVGFADRKDDADTHQPSTVWPFQKFEWNDLTVKTNDRVSYRVIPVIGTSSSDIKPDFSRASAWSMPKVISGGKTSGDIFEAYFNRGIVAAQWLNKILDRMNAKHPASALEQVISEVNNPTRNYLSGYLRLAILNFLNQAHSHSNHKVYIAIFELNDPEIIDMLKKLKSKAHVILANGAHSKEEPDENVTSRKELVKAGVNVYDRMVTELAHNKFAVMVESGKPKVVLTGSTNWTMSALCTQCNNLLIIKDERIADTYFQEWQQLQKIGNESGKDLREFNAELCQNDIVEYLDNGNKVQVRTWFAPITKEIDLDEAKEYIVNAREGILFLMFNPGSEGTLYNTIVDVANDKSRRLHIHGVLNQDPSTHEHPVEILHAGKKHDVRDADVVLPAAVGGFSAGWIKELKMKQGAHAIVHSKIIVIDPFGDDPIVITGSHNLGPKASSKNDENLVIVRGCKPLAEAYAINVQSVFTHYHWRYYMSTMKNQSEAWSSLENNDDWQDKYLDRDNREARELDFWFGELKPETIHGKIHITETVRYSSRHYEKDDEENEGKKETGKGKSTAKSRVTKATKPKVEAKTKAGSKSKTGTRGRPRAQKKGKSKKEEGDDDDDVEEEEEEEYEEKVDVDFELSEEEKPKQKRKARPTRARRPRRKVGDSDSYRYNEDDEDEGGDDDDDEYVDN